jgi:glycosyltransferase involved in cell wall biosynthesis
MNTLVFLVPGRIDTLTGGYGYDRQMVDGLRRRGWSVGVHELDASFPQPTPDARREAAGVLGAIPDGTAVVIDGLALGAMPDETWREAGRLRIVALVHHPLALETGLDPHLTRRLEKSERRALGAVRLIIVTSRATADALRRYNVAPDRIVVVEPGTDPAPLSRGSGGQVRNLLCVASLVPRKGHDTLFRAVARLPRSDWLLTCVGSRYHSPATVRRLCAYIAEQALEDYVRLVGQVDAATLADAFDRADVFVLPTRYEGYGMAVAEALAHGVPVISTPTGAIDELIGRDAGILVPPGDADALTAALWRVLDDEAFRQRLRDGARRMRSRLPSWSDQVDRMADVLAGVATVRRSPFPQRL